MEEKFNGPSADSETYTTSNQRHQRNNLNTDPLPSSSGDIAVNLRSSFLPEQVPIKTNDGQDPISCSISESGTPVEQAEKTDKEELQTETLVRSTLTIENDPNQSSENQEHDDGWRHVVVGGSLIPPTNFGMIEDDMYRSGLAIELNFAFLEQLRLKTMLYLASEELPDALLDFIEDQGIELVQLAPQQDELPAPWKPISEDVVLSAMEYLLDPSTYPIYVMCSQGRHRTGTVIGCLRKLQRWILSSIFEEYHRYADGRGRLANEQFIELFDTDLVNLPTTNRPRWLRSRPL